MDKISQPLFGVLVVGLRQVGRHVERPLPQEGLRIRRHVRQVVHDDEHLDDGAERVEKRHLDCSFLRNAIPFFAQVDVTYGDKKR